MSWRRRRRPGLRLRLAVIAPLVVLAGCEGCPPSVPSGWALVRDQVPGALLSVQAKDGAIWTSGGDADGPDGPATATLLVDDNAFDDVDFVAIETGLQGDLWWVQPLSATVALAGGSSGRVVRIDRSSATPTVTALSTPADAAGDDPDLIVFGVYAADGDDDVWAVGGRNGGISGGFAWRSVAGGPFVDVPLPPGDVESYALWKVAGTGPTDVWIVGTNGLAFHFDGTTLSPIPTGQNTSLFTVHVDGGEALAVGGVGRGLAMARSADADAWVDVTPEGDQTPPLLGVHRRDGVGCAVGASGTFYGIDGDAFAREAFGFAMFASLHACHVDDDGLVWAVGGRLTGLPLTGGVLLRRAP